MRPALARIRVYRPLLQWLALWLRGSSSCSRGRHSKIMAKDRVTDAGIILALRCPTSELSQAELRVGGGGDGGG